MSESNFIRKKMLHIANRENSNRWAKINDIASVTIKLVILGIPPWVGYTRQYQEMVKRIDSSQGHWHFLIVADGEYDLIHVHRLTQRNVGWNWLWEQNPEPTGMSVEWTNKLVYPFCVGGACLYSQPCVSWGRKVNSLRPPYPQQNN